MRLDDYEVSAIKSVIISLDSSAKIYLFGSRVDDTKRGGDIDLLIFSDKLCNNDIFDIKEDICDKIGDQKIDIIIARDDSDPFVRIALKEGVLL